MASEEAEHNANPSPSPSPEPNPNPHTAAVEDQKETEAQEDRVESKEITEVSKVVEAQTLHNEEEEQAEETGGQQTDVADAEAEAESKTGAEAEIGAEIGAETGAEAETGDDADADAEAGGEEESEKPRKLTVDDIKTAPMDFRFPTTNQAKHCFTRYIEYHKCVQAKGEDNPDCSKYARYYRSLCPGEWIDKWNEQRENGTFPGPL